ncbi:uncharacterized protein LOC123710523 isoform X3 [Pieris brassicae]|uniref:uncharacterized protein LOC123710523 isoform X3 n=1 Tax=Pieris brassicae TaxID=7116 RepID=UPI001E66181C|nr:uncharacterized protein LOC123710523 isoform X3 [Pieris brassicae]
MIGILIAVAVVSSTFGTEDYYFYPFNNNISRSTPMGIAAYRSALTLDWIAAEDLRQRELAAAFETEASPVRVISSDCVGYPKPTSGKIGRLMLELLKNLEGDDGTLVPELMQVLVRTKFLVESSMFDSEPDLHSLVKMPNVMMGEPHTTFPRILAIIWMLVTDPVTTKKYGWCPIKKKLRRSSSAAKHGKKRAHEIAAFPIYQTRKNISTAEPNIQDMMELPTEQSHILFSRSNTLKPMFTLMFSVLFV